MHARRITDCLGAVFPAPPVEAVTLLRANAEAILTVCAVAGFALSADPSLRAYARIVSYRSLLRIFHICEEPINIIYQWFGVVFLQLWDDHRFGVDPVAGANAAIVTHGLVVDTEVLEADSGVAGLPCPALLTLAAVAPVPVVIQETFHEVTKAGRRNWLVGERGWVKENVSFLCIVARR